MEIWRKGKPHNESGRLQNARLSYGVAACLGIAAAWWMLPWATVAGVGGLWAAPGGDAAVALTGHLAFQAPGWHWPLLTAANLAWPTGRSIALTDSNPLVSLAAKVVSTVRGRPVNLLGVWLAACWILQPIAAVFAFRTLSQRFGAPCRWEACAAVAALSLLCPAWLMRARHVNLMGHCLLLAALGLALRRPAADARHWAPACLLLCVAILTHPYLFVVAAITLAVPAIAQPGWRVARGYVASCAIPVVLLMVLSGSGGGNASGFGHYSMNLFSPVWPQLSGLFGAGLPILDATGGQYEGFNYQGAGVLLLAACAAACLVRRRPAMDGTRTRDLRALLIPLGVLTLLALSPRIYAGRLLVLGLPLQPWRGLLAPIQSSGRAFWIVGYAGLLGSVAILSARLPRAPGAMLLAGAVVLQMADAGPALAIARDLLAGRGQAKPPFTMMAGATLLRIVPACDPVNAPADLLRLLAIRAGLALADMRMARPPPGFDCETALSDGLELPLDRTELRFFLPSAQAGFRQAALGAGSACVSLSAGILCSGAALALPGAAVLPPGLPIATLPPAGSTIRGSGLAPLLSTGWRQDAAGIAWSEGSIATLLFRQADSPAAITVELDGVAAEAGGARSIGVAIGQTAPRIIPLTDGVTTQVTLPLPDSGVGRAPVRVVFVLKRPVDPVRRGLTAPVHRAAIRLRALRVP